MMPYTVQDFVIEVRDNFLDEHELPFAAHGPGYDGLLCMGVYLTLIRKRYGKRLAELDRLAIGKVIIQCLDQKLGLLPTPVDLSPANSAGYTGFSAASLALETRVVPSRLLAHGPRLKRLDIRALLKMAAGEPLSLLERLWCVAACFMPVWSASHVVATWLRFQWLRADGKILAWAISRWEKEVEKQYARGFETAFSEYFGEQHPFTKALASDLPKPP